MKKIEGGGLADLSARYVLLLVFGLVVYGSDIAYKLLLPATIYPLKVLLGLFYSVLRVDNVLIIDSTAIELIPACLAVSAFFMLLALNLITPMNARKRLFSLAFSLASLLLLNIVRIALLTIMLIKELPIFDIVHKIIWYALSIFFVAGIWFLAVRLFRIRAIPAYADISFLRKFNSHNY